MRVNIDHIVHHLERVYYRCMVTPVVPAYLVVDMPEFAHQIHGNLSRVTNLVSTAVL